MPMPSQTNYQWRPNDNGITNHRYDLEAEKWVNAFNNATAKLPTGDYAGDFKFMGAVVMLPLLLIFLILFIPIKIIKEVVGFNIKLLPGDPPTGWIDRRTHMEKVDDRLNALKEQYPSKRKRKSTWEDLTSEQQKIVRFVKEETARAKTRANLNKL